MVLLFHMAAAIGSPAFHLRTVHASGDLAGRGRAPVRCALYSGALVSCSDSLQLKAKEITSVDIKEKQ